MRSQPVMSKIGILACLALLSSYGSSALPAHETISDATHIYDEAEGLAQSVFRAPVTTTNRKLHGRFLQISDMHPDPYYLPKTSISSSCHRKKGRKKDGRKAGLWGTSFSDCDSPFALTNFTLDYLEEHWADEIDFVIWTGDNARHDSDRKRPRTPAEIYELNRAVAKRMDKTFGKRGIPVVPSLGNNDVWPHNIMTPGPNSITNEFSSIWKSFIPFPSYQIFLRGAYYMVEVIPNRLAVVALNTMYFYDSNKAVGGCEYKDREDPGNLQLDWLEVQLEQLRDRGLQVWITGHVPPSPGNYFSECYVRYAELALRFQDTIVGHLYGHMNADHFSFVEADDLQLDASASRSQKNPQSQAQGDLYATLLEEFADIPKDGKVDLGQYGVINVSPPVVPNPYLPTFRIFSYNITGHNTIKEQKKRDHGHKHRGKDKGDKEQEKLCKKSEWKETWKCVLRGREWFTDADAPSRTNRLWTPLGYAQYFIPNLDKANKKHAPKFKLEYLTYSVSSLHPTPGNDTSGTEWHYPVPLKELPKSLQNSKAEIAPNEELSLQSDGEGKEKKDKKKGGKGKKKKSKYCPYEMEDLTINSWVKLARRLGDTKEHKLRKRFRKYMYLGADKEG